MSRWPETVEVRLVFRRLSTSIKGREVYLLDRWAFEGDPPMAVVETAPDEEPAPIMLETVLAQCTLDAIRKGMRK